MKLNRWLCLVTLSAALGLAGCNSDSGSSSTTTGTTTSGSTGSTGPSGASGGGDASKNLVVFCQANSKDPWRQVFDQNMKSAAEKYKGVFTFQEETADDDANKQISQIETVLVKQPRVLLVSPVNVSVTKAIEKAFDKGIQVILLDRSIESQKYTTYISGDNTDIGRQAGEFMGKQMNGKGTILMIRGIADATPTHERGDGFMKAIKAFPGIKVIVGDDCGYQRQKATDYMSTFLQKKQPFDAVYAHNDEMAIGAYLAMDRAGVKGKMVVGIDGCQQEVVQYIKDGKMAATFKYPQPGEKGLDLAADFIKSGKIVSERKITLPTEIVTKDTADQYLKDNPNLAK